MDTRWTPLADTKRAARAAIAPIAPGTIPMAKAKWLRGHEWMIIEVTGYCAGSNVSLDEIEQALRSLPGVYDTCQVIDGHFGRERDLRKQVRALMPVTPNVTERPVWPHVQLKRNMMPGQRLRADESKAPPKVLNWRDRLWTAIGKAAGPLGLLALVEQLEREQADLDPDSRQRMVELLQEQIVIRQRMIAALGHDVTPAVTARLCACGCGNKIPSLRPEARYFNGACRVRAHRAR